MIRKLTQEEIALVKPLIDRERNFILYSNLQIRQERALDGIRSKRTLVLMKLKAPEKLLPAEEAQRLDGSDLAAVNKLARETGLMSFRIEELEEMPHVGIFDGDTLISMAGFHIYEDNYVELGNIATLPRLQGRGLGKRVTSEIARVGLEKTDAVYLFVFDDNATAIHIYEKLGFETIRRYSMFELDLSHSL